MKQDILAQIDESIETKRLLKAEIVDIEKAIRLVISCLKNGGKVILFGNGGSAADAQHIAAEFIGRYQQERKALPAIALSVNTSNITSIANDYGYEHVFEKQVEGLCSPRDVVIGISTSGNSRNVLLGIKASRRKGAKSIGMTGKGKNRLSQIVDVCIRVPSNVTPRIQESHCLVGHIICGVVEHELFKE